LKELDLLRLCALLHDIGKPLCWAKRKRWSDHIHYAYDLIAPHLGEEIALTAMRHHVGTNYPVKYRPKTDVEWVIHMADEISSGADRPERPLKGPPIPSPPIRLTHILSDGSKVRREIDEAELAYASREVEEVLAKAGEADPAECYMKVYEYLGGDQSRLRFIPADTRTPVNDVSLWDHLKLTAALAVCIWIGGGYKSERPEDYSFALLSGDADKVSRFINASSRLPDLRAGSQMVERATKAAVGVIKDALGPECIIFSGGGGFLAVAPTSRADEILREAKDKFEAVTNGELTITVNSIVVDGAEMKMRFGDVWRDAMVKIRLKKLSAPSSPARIMVDEGVPLCDNCGVRPAKHPTRKILPYDAAPRYEMLCDVCYHRRVSREGRGVELEKIADERGLVAVIKADGDNLGRVLDGTKIKEFKKTVTPSRLSAISRMIDRVCKIELRSVVGKYGGECIYSGGDDLLAVLPGCRAFDCAVELSSAFNREMAGKLTLSAGVAVFDKKFPIYVALEAVSQLIENAKCQPEKSSIDFEVISATEVTPDDINYKRRLYYKERGLSDRPYKWDRFMELLRFSKSLGTGVIPSAQLNMIVSIIKMEGSDAAQDYVKYQMGRGLIPWRLGEKLLEYLKSGFFLDAFTVYNAVYRR